ncbi:cytidylyltransferase domain-containing protein [Aestuariispira insulae]|uniref:Spore coat polysaccharide biosynthesis protein SpsF n=1 Tax=Aestuariispira insulae TaxID=1461337 RepID=A0A3D9HU85_9PROT|nr:hypothetical protein [Aestuariispira insulae]RED52446.1 spore coat polysaccharide biosynthesis protein SpsF [Aestuariispira insulae]
MTGDKNLRGQGALVLLARLDSSRLPGKQLKPLGDGTVLDLMARRLANCHHDIPIILATSDRAIDNPLADFAQQRGLQCFRGNIDDVAGRCLACLQAFNLDWFVRLCGDSPFADPVLIDRIIDVFLTSDCEIATNVFPRTTPFGASVEIVSRPAMERICRETDDMAFLEHVTLFAYRHPDRFKIQNVGEESGAYGDLSLSVDTADDLAMAQWIANKLTAPVEAPLTEIVALAQQWRAETGGRP